MRTKTITCAYCGEPGQRSREHIFPTWLRKKTPTYDIGYSKIKGRFSPNEGVVRDVCTKCNTGPLSQLDDYCHGLYTSYFSKIPYSKVEFRYDFDKLARWLPKVSFNSARLHKAYVDPFKSLIPYILGKDPGPPDQVLFFVEVVKPSRRILRGKDVVFEPREHRIGKIAFKDKPCTVFIRDGRSVAIDAYYFSIIFLHAQANDVAYEHISPIFPSSVRLDPAARSIDLQPGREYFDVKWPTVLMRLDAEVDAYRRYQRQQQKGQEE